MLERLFVTRYLIAKSKGSVVRTMALLSVGGIALGVMAMVVVLSVMGGFDDTIKTRLLGVEPHIVTGDVTPAVKTEIMGLVGSRGSVESFSKQDVIVRTLDGIFSGAVAQGMENQALKFLGKRVHHNIEVEETPTGSMSVGKSQTGFIDFDLGPKEVALGIDLARSLGVFEGDEVNLLAPENLLLPSGEVPLYEKVKVRALVRTNVADIDSHFIFYNVSGGLKKLQDTASLERGLEIRFDNPDEAFTLLPELSRLKVPSVKTWRELNSALFYSLKMERSLMGLFLGLTILVSSFSIVAVLMLLVTEKRADVGILKAIGATKRKIRRIFIAIGMTLGLVGILSGAAIGLFMCWILATYPIIRLPDIYYDTSVPVHVEKGVVLGVVILGALLTMLGTFIPANKVAQYTPIDAIKSDPQ